MQRASAPGKLIVSGEYAVLDGAPALVLAMDRRAIARCGAVTALSAVNERSLFLAALAETLAAHGEPAAAAVARTIVVDSSGFYDGATKLGFGSSAAVTVAATALALAASSSDRGLDLAIDRDRVLAIATAAHAAAQGSRGARGSGADIAAAIHGGAIAFVASSPPRIAPRRWPSPLRLVPFFTGAAADTATLVAQVVAARAAHPGEVDAALVAIAEASAAACEATELHDPALAATSLLAALRRDGEALDQLARATDVALVPPCVVEVRRRLELRGGWAKTTGAGGGDIAIAVISATTDESEVTRIIIESGCTPVRSIVDERGVDLIAGAE